MNRPDPYLIAYEHHQRDQLGNVFDIYAPVAGDFIHVLLAPIDADDSIEIVLDKTGAKALGDAIIRASEQR